MSDKPLPRLASTANSGESLSAEDVATYLRDHPDFFVGRDALLGELLLPHGSTGSVSLVERQLKVLRERNQSMRRRLNEMVRTARQNHRLFERTLELTLRLMETAGTEARLRRLEDGLTSGFDLDAVAMHGIETEGFSPDLRRAIAVTSEADAQPTVGHLLRPGRIVCGLLREPELAFLFAGQEADVASAAVMPVEVPGGLLLLALGSRDPNHFTPDMGTMFVRFLGDAIARMLMQEILPVGGTPLGGTPVGGGAGSTGTA
ncbi:MAG: DUF484 family protein [Gammaproteobacteria bacterium]|nr:DUF484 family protein [Gammaproteobacteria bacterium]